jgi:hypothetical protein
VVIRPGELADRRLPLLALVLRGLGALRPTDSVSRRGPGTYVLARQVVWVGSRLCPGDEYGWGLVGLAFLAFWLVVFGVGGLACGGLLGGWFYCAGCGGHGWVELAVEGAGVGLVPSYFGRLLGLGGRG